MDASRDRAHHACESRRGRRLEDAETSLRRPGRRLRGRPPLSRKIGILPAAGHAERLQPLEGSKEAIQVGGRPMLEYAVDRLRAAGPDELRIVVRPEKLDVLELARALGVTVIEARPGTLAESVLAGITDLAEDDVVLLDLPDSLWEPVDGYAMLLDALTGRTEVVLGVFRSAHPQRGDVVSIDSDGRVRAVHVKSTEPPADLIWGAAVARVRALDGLRRHTEPGELFDELARTGQVRAVRFPGEFVDIGTKEALGLARKRLD